MTLRSFLLARIAEDEAELTEPTEFNQRAWAECQAKRRIVDECAEAASFAGDYDLDPKASLGEDTLKHLASVYSDHPDYRDEWRP